MLGGQNKYCGKTIDDAINYWNGLGVYHIMVKSTNGFPLVKNGKVHVESFKKLERLQNEDDRLSFHLHPYNIKIERNGQKILLDFLSENTAGDYKKLLEGLDEQIQTRGLYPNMDLHISVLKAPPNYGPRNEERGLYLAERFFQDLDLETNVSLETMHGPDKNPGYRGLGDKPEHFERIIGDRTKDYKICIDTGHHGISEHSAKEFLKLPYEIGSIHHHGNDGNRDQHLLPNRNNVRDFDCVEGLIRKFDGPVVLEIKRNDNYRVAVKKVIDRLK